MTDAKTLYDRDFVLWTETQAEALRAAARRSTNQAIDWEHLTEEVESLGASERRELHSQIRRIIRHLLKLEHSPASDLRRGWEDAADGARSEIELMLKTSPSLKREVGAVIETELARGSQRAIRDLEKHDELDVAIVSRIRAARYTEDQVPGDWFPPEPGRPPGTGG